MQSCIVRTLVRLSLAVLLFTGLASTLQAQNIETATVNLATNRITITGVGFGKKKPPVTFGGVSLSVISYSDTLIVASLGNITAPGTYLLAVNADPYDELDVTLGVEGPQGPQGPIGMTGPTGMQGPIGMTGATGMQGPIGMTGATGMQGPIGMTGAAGPTGPPGPVFPSAVTGPCVGGICLANIVMPTGTVSRGTNFTVSFDYSQTVNQGCPDCVEYNALEISTEASAGNGVVSGSSVNCFAGSYFPTLVQFQTGTPTLTFTAPSSPGIYYLFLDAPRPEYYCGENGTNGTPSPTQYVGAIFVQ